jgi:hypothetical protein
MPGETLTAPPPVVARLIPQLKLASETADASIPHGSDIRRTSSTRRYIKAHCLLRHHCLRIVWRSASLLSSRWKAKIPALLKVGSYTRPSPLVKLYPSIILSRRTTFDLRYIAHLVSHLLQFVSEAIATEQLKYTCARTLGDTTINICSWRKAKRWINSNRCSSSISYYRQTH